jgi:hypothetical protein
LFGATDDRRQDRVLYGDEATVVSFVQASGVASAKTLVLINSAFRAGAGGFDSRRPSWCTDTSAPGERWEDVALHELGHAFGLADEYEDASGATPEPDPLEPNVTAEPDAQLCPWVGLVTVRPPPAPTRQSGVNDALPDTAVGTFEGARYRPEGRYRPSPNCRMRVTTAAFCPVCADHIRRQLTQP